MDTEVMTDSVKERGISDRDAVDSILVEKRDGRIVDFDPVNIMNAIEAAFKDVKHEVSPEDRQQIRGMALTVQSEITDRYTNPVKIEDIQTLVEHALVNAHLYEIARSYTSYRLDRDIQRAKATDVIFADRTHSITS